MSALEAGVLPLGLERKTHFSSCSYSSPQRSEALGASPSWVRAASLCASVVGQGNHSRRMSCPAQHRAGQSRSVKLLMEGKITNNAGKQECFNLCY